MKIARKIVSAPALKDYVDEEIEPGININSDEEWLDFARLKGEYSLPSSWNLQDGQ